MKDSTIIEDGSNVIKPQQFKIETPIGSVESDSGNHVIDVASVIIVISAIFIVYKLYKKWR